MAAIDNIMHASTSAHEAAEIGQLTLFGGVEDVANEDILGGISPEARPTSKEILEWEKELVGVYVSSHPLQKMTVDLMNVITHNTVDVTEELAGKAVCVAGMVADVRIITTKKGDSMAFVRLEDLTGRSTSPCFRSSSKRNDRSGPTTKSWSSTARPTCATAASASWPIRCRITSRGPRSSRTGARWPIASATARAKAPAVPRSRSALLPTTPRRPLPVIPLGLPPASPATRRRTGVISATRIRSRLRSRIGCTGNGKQVDRGTRKQGSRRGKKNLGRLRV